MQFRCWWRASGFLLLVALQPHVSWAVLGGSAAAVAQDGLPVIANGHQLAQQIQGVQQQSVVTAENVTVTEFSAQGIVFAIRWSGPVMPDLSHLLGTYFSQYATMIPPPSAAIRNKPIAIDTPGLAVHASGHMRAFSGSAYAPGLAPAGLNLNTLGVDR